MTNFATLEEMDLYVAAAKATEENPDHIVGEATMAAESALLAHRMQAALRLRFGCELNDERITVTVNRVEESAPPRRPVVQATARLKLASRSEMTASVTLVPDGERWTMWFDKQSPQPGSWSAVAVAVPIAWMESLAAAFSARVAGG